MTVTLTMESVAILLGHMSVCVYLDSEAMGLPVVVCVCVCVVCVHECVTRACMHPCLHVYTNEVTNSYYFQNI